METTTKPLKIGYYAVLREQRGLSEEQLETAAETPGELYQSLKETHGFHLEAEQLRVVINDAFKPWDTPLRAGDSVVFIPPVAGG